jgi:hypothetical protein
MPPSNWIAKPVSDSAERRIRRIKTAIPDWMSDIVTPVTVWA